MRKSLFALTLIFAATCVVHAGHTIVEGKTTVDKSVVDEFPYTKGTIELEVDAGAYGSIGTKGTEKRPDVGYAMGDVRLGIMAWSPMGPGCLRGNLEVMLEGFGAGIFAGPGNYLAGGDLVLRYNFVQPNAKCVPFLQIGGGGVYSDTNEVDTIQHNIGSDWSFSLEAGLGARYHISRNVAITTIFEYRHISNADTAERNQGLNALGGTIGLSLFY